jgi:mannose-1-phosphate guanylyltransferase/mannose-6-phosphate isomerase
MTLKLTPFILCGGSGTRLWPVSRASLPKQYCDFFGTNLFSTTLARFEGAARIGVVSTSSQLSMVNRFLPDSVPDTKVVKVLEPFGKNTAAAVALAVRQAERSTSGETVIGIFPADHHIADENAFLAAVKTATQDAEAGAIVTLGITPTFPATGYGYIETEKGGASRKATRFHEKPDSAKAAEYLASGNFFWNAGIFISRVDVLAQAFASHAPELWSGILAIQDPLAPTTEEYSKLPSISFDVAIMEKLPFHTCIPVTCGWSDVGSWDTLINTLGTSPEDKTDQNTIRIDSPNSQLIPYRDREYVFIDCPDVNIVDTADALLVYKTGSSEKVKTAFEALKKKNPSVADQHPFEYRPWGSFEVLRDSAEFKSKVIEVLPGQRLSYQSHTQRAEHWIIISGEPEVTLNDVVLKPKPGEHVFIPIGAKHRIANPGSSTVQFVEVQVGTYFGEDDIVRYQDDYKRS